MNNPAVDITVNTKYNALYTGLGLVTTFNADPTAPAANSQK